MNENAGQRTSPCPQRRPITPHCPTDINGNPIPRSPVMNENAGQRTSPCPQRGPITPHCPTDINGNPIPRSPVTQGNGNPNTRSPPINENPIPRTSPCPQRGPTTSFCPTDIHGNPNQRSPVIKENPFARTSIHGNPNQRSTVIKENPFPRTSRGETPGDPIQGNGNPNTRSPPCAAIAPAGDVNLVRPQLNEVLKAMRFGLTSFTDNRFNTLRELCNIIEQQKKNLVAVQCFFQEFEPVLSAEFDILPNLMRMWENYAVYINQMYNQSTDPCNPKPNINSANHPSPAISQEAFTELLRASRALCLEVGRGMRIMDIMNSKLDDNIMDAKRTLEEIFKKLHSTELTAAAIGNDSQDWLRRFREMEHSLQVFLEEWQRGGDQLNQPPANIATPPAIPELGAANDEEAADPGAEPIENIPSSPRRGDQQTQCPANIAGSPQRGGDQLNQPQANIATPQLGQRRISEVGGEQEISTSPSVPPPSVLARLIQQFHDLNKNLTEEALQNVHQQEVLNENRRTIDELPLSSAQQPSTSTQQPSTSTQQPPTFTQKPPSPTRQPSTSTQQPPTV